jgi:AcrR family transcriptional regulator
VTVPTPRDRLLRTAADLFYREGVAPVGVERLCRAAGVSKRSMYQLFDTKEDLVAESLRVHGPGIVAGYFPAADAELSPRERIRFVFERLDEQSGTPGFHGCPFVNTAVETREPGHPATAVARGFKDQLTAYLAAHAAQLGVADPEMLAVQLTMVFDGAAVRAVMRGTSLDGAATRTAEALLAAAGA